MLIVLYRDNRGATVYARYFGVYLPPLVVKDYMKGTENHSDLYITDKC